MGKRQLAQSNEPASPGWGCIYSVFVRTLQACMHPLMSPDTRSATVTSLNMSSLWWWKLWRIPARRKNHNSVHRKRSSKNNYSQLFNILSKSKLGNTITRPLCCRKSAPIQFVCFLFESSQHGQCIRQTDIIHLCFMLSMCIMYGPTNYHNMSYVSYYSQGYTNLVFYLFYQTGSVSSVSADSNWTFFLLLLFHIKSLQRQICMLLLLWRRQRKCSVFVIGVSSAVLFCNTNRSYQLDMNKFCTIWPVDHF